MMDINTHDLSAFLAENPQAVVVDVRFANERNEYGYVLGSKHVPLFTGDWDENPDFAEELFAAAPQDVPVIFVCRSGNRSCVACELAIGLGYQQVYNLKGGHVELVGFYRDRLEAGRQLLHLPV
jgi:rhodanese-related sulfurtransferase